eukprot:TRINITY_DN2138_c0_g1_i1.p1 TRINITY_DN2138_c0_g1~~TRINITY_DN2138_c0_g1_i1.p1  ORF type:complete len:170 (+),score=36.80 TRINITY_DN2138_c0_g1_i1:28-510(+)
MSKRSREESNEEIPVKKSKTSEGPPKSITIENSFSVLSWDENTTESGPIDANRKVTRALASQKYEGTIMSGTSQVNYIMYYRNASTASFLGYEVFTGEVNGIEGTLVFEHGGKFENGVASSDFTLTGATGNLEQYKTGKGSYETNEEMKGSFKMVLGGWD